MDWKVFSAIAIIVLGGACMAEFYQIAFTIPKLEDEREYYKNTTQLLCEAVNFCSYSVNTLIQNYTLPYNQVLYVNCSGLVSDGQISHP